MAAGAIKGPEEKRRSSITLLYVGKTPRDRQCGQAIIAGATWRSLPVRADRSKPGISFARLHPIVFQAAPGNH